MAIPFALPSEEESDDQSQQQLEQLMLELYSALQQVLRARNAQHPSRNQNPAHMQRNLRLVQTVEKSFARKTAKQLTCFFEEEKHSSRCNESCCVFYVDAIIVQLFLSKNDEIKKEREIHDCGNRLPRRSSQTLSSRDSAMVLVDSDLSRLPLPDLVLSAVEQLPSVAPQVTVSAPSSPTRDAAFQFPECSGFGSGTLAATSLLPVPCPRPKPRRRRLTSEGSLPEKFQQQSTCHCSMRHHDCCTHGNSCCGHHLAASLDEREWASVGANLRNIADDFHASKAKDAEVEKSRLSFIGSSFGSSSSLNSNNLSGSTSGSTDSLMSLLIPAPLRETLWTTLALYLGWRLVSRLR
uniref:Uncharacterized protein n=1 Tax=Trichogramma kaykai TaxID=54128 RepID=A0ABD2VZB2_9HYME